MTTNDVDLRPEPKLRKHARLWQSYLAWHGQMEQRKRHNLRITAAERGKSNLDPGFERELIDLLNLDAIVKPRNKAERATSPWQMMVNYGEAVGPIWEWCLDQRGLGAGLTAQLLAQINDIEQFATVSKLWRHSGYGIYPYWLNEKDQVQAPRLGYKWLKRGGEKVKVLTATAGPEEMGEALFWLGEYGGGLTVDTPTGEARYRASIETVFALFPHLKLRHVGKTLGRVVARYGEGDSGMVRAMTAAAIQVKRESNELEWSVAVERVGAFFLPPQPVIPLRLEIAEPGWRLSRHKDVKLSGYHSPFNGSLKAICFNIADQFIRHQSSPWVDLYYAEKTRQHLLHPEKVKVHGKWRYNDGHLHARARRKMIKEFLKELWLRWRANPSTGSGEGE